MATLELPARPHDDEPWERIIRRCEMMPSGCLEYMGFRVPRGAGLLRRTGYAHVVMYEACYGPVPKGYDVHHMCENPPCCNPRHLRALTRSEHKRWHSQGRGRDVGPCVICGGNEWLYYKSGPRVGHRYCRPCNRERSRATWLRRKET